MHWFFASTPWRTHLKYHRITTATTTATRHKLGLVAPMPFIVLTRLNCSLCACMCVRVWRYFVVAIFFSACFNKIETKKNTHKRWRTHRDKKKKKKNKRTENDLSSHEKAFARESDTNRNHFDSQHARRIQSHACFDSARMCQCQPEIR